jgi:hypothetical protein
MQETWREIYGTNGRYSVSDLGRVRSNWADVPRRNLTYRVRIDKVIILRAYAHTTGYLRVSLGRSNQRYVHRLVAATFLSNPELCPQVDHIDGNRQNNQLSNLRWVTAKQNALAGGERHQWEAQKIANAQRRIHDVRKKEYQSLIDQGYSLRRIAKLFGTSHSTIRRALDY